MVFAVDQPNARPLTYDLAQNHPNPFNAATTIRYSLPDNAHVIIEIFDILGRKVDRLYSGLKPAGNHTLTWQARGISSGIYFYRLQTGGFSEIRKCLMMK